MPAALAIQGKSADRPVYHLTVSRRRCPAADREEGGVPAWIDRHPHVTGVLLTQPQALALGVDMFGALLDH